MDAAETIESPHVSRQDNQTHAHAMASLHLLTRMSFPRCRAQKAHSTKESTTTIGTRPRAGQQVLSSRSSHIHSCIHVTTETSFATVGHIPGGGGGGGTISAAGIAAATDSSDTLAIPPSPIALTTHAHETCPVASLLTTNPLPVAASLLLHLSLLLGDKLSNSNCPVNLPTS